MSSHLWSQPVVAEVVRSGVVESVHHGTVVGLAADGTIVLEIGDPRELVFPRSANKPMQAIAMLRNGLELDGKLLALAAASHSGEDFHVDGARRILSGAGLDEEDLQCPPAWPMDQADLVPYVRGGGEADRLRMNCSGKHAAMLATCVVNEWPTETYLEPDHPLQQAIREVLEEFTGDRMDTVAVDGCGAPLFGCSLLGLARAFRRLAIAEPGTPERAVADAYREHPEWTSGSRREETQLMSAVPGLINKAGAEGVDALATPDGRAVALKITDGSQRARVPVSVAALQRLGVDSDGLDRLATSAVHGGGRDVGEIRAVLP